MAVRRNNVDCMGMANAVADGERQGIAFPDAH